MSDNVFNGKERRAYFRLESVLKVQLRLPGNNPAKTYTATTKNISHGGLCVEVPHHQKELLEKLCAAGEDSELNLEATIRINTLKIATEPAWIKCKMDWAKESATKDLGLTMGLSFKNLAENTRQQIRNFIIEEYVKSYGKNDREKRSVG